MQIYNLFLFRISSKFQPSESSDNANISLYPFGDELYAFSESRILHKVNPEDLSTDGRIQLTDYLAVLHNTSHPHVVEDGKLHFIAPTISLIQILK